jgi:presenilin 1
MPAGMIFEGDFFRLGVGDLVFYGVLVGRASIYGFLPALSCFLAIQVGVVATIYVASSSSLTVPALPASILAGIVTYVMAIFLLSPLFDSLAQLQLYV